MYRNCVLRTTKQQWKKSRSEGRGTSHSQAKRLRSQRGQHPSNWHTGFPKFPPNLSGAFWRYRQNYSGLHIERQRELKQLKLFWKRRKWENQSTQLQDQHIASIIKTALLVDRRAKTSIEWNREPRMSHKHAHWFLTKEQKLFIQWDMSFSANGAETTGHPLAKQTNKKLWPKSLPYINIREHGLKWRQITDGRLKCILDLNVTCEYLYNL